MLAALLALGGALVYGSSDFLGGRSATRLRAIVVTSVAGVAGLALFALALPLVGGRWTATDAAWGALSGVLGVVAIALLYACLAIGPMSVLSPVTAVVSAIAPMTWGLLSGESLGIRAAIGLPLALVAVVLIALLPGAGISRPTPRGLLMAVGSGLAIGAFLIALDQTSRDSGLVPLIANRSVNALLTGAIVLVLAVRASRSRTPLREALTLPDPRPGTGRAGMTVRSALLLAVAGGLLDATANAIILFALRSGDLSVVSALTALYPAGTVLLAAIVLRERIAGIQWIGLVLALVAGALLATA